LQFAPANTLEGFFSDGSSEEVDWFYSDAISYQSAFTWRELSVDEVKSFIKPLPIKTTKETTIHLFCTNAIFKGNLVSKLLCSKSHNIGPNYTRFASFKVEVPLG
jgi:hypothetical protein